jgi:hypothetical protein
LEEHDRCVLDGIGSDEPMAIFVGRRLLSECGMLNSRTLSGTG